MARIQVLDTITIDKIAAGEVVERPASVAKELVENAIDAGASKITIEIKDGGISFLRITDSGSGIEKDQVRNAFLRHATSKISSAEDLSGIDTLGFRGEALASIAAVSQVEMITKTSEDLTGIHYVIEGGKEILCEEVGAPDGTTIIVKNIFFNTPARRKFLKRPQTEALQIEDLAEHLAMSHPDVSFQLIMNGQVRFSTSGNGNLQEVVYRIYGKEFSTALQYFTAESESLGIKVSGFLGRPTFVRASRSFEIFFINGRFIKSGLLSKAVEDGYFDYLMAHKFPVCILNFEILGERVDVNVHPTKMEVRISDEIAVKEFISKEIKSFLNRQEMIPAITLDKERPEQKSVVRKQDTPELFEHNRIIQRTAQAASEEKRTNDPFEKQTMSSVSLLLEQYKKPGKVNEPTVFFEDDKPVLAKPEPKQSLRKELTNELVKEPTKEPTNELVKEPAKESVKESVQEPTKESAQKTEVKNEKTTSYEQLDLFKEKILTKSARQNYRVIGQLFDTYWLVEYKDQLLMIDQHAAHEKVKYEKLLKQLNEASVITQYLNPPVIITLSSKESAMLKEQEQFFKEFGFAIEAFGGNEYALREVPQELYGNQPADMFLEIIGQMTEAGSLSNTESIRMKIATTACKAAVKGNNRMSVSELEALLDQLLELDNPYHCPHGRPTMITMSKHEMEKKFKRIV